MGKSQQEIASLTHGFGGVVGFYEVVFVLLNINDVSKNIFAGLKRAKFARVKCSLFFRVAF